MQQGKLILTIPAGIQLTSLPLKPVPETPPLPGGLLLGPPPPAPLTPGGVSSPGALVSSPLSFINSSPLYGGPDGGGTGGSLSYTTAPQPGLEPSVLHPHPSHHLLTPESLLSLSPMCSGAPPGPPPSSQLTQLSQSAWSPVSLPTSAGLTLFDVRGVKGELGEDPALLGLPGGESLLLGGTSPDQDGGRGSPLVPSEEMEEDSKILTQLQPVPVGGGEEEEDEELGL